MEPPRAPNRSCAEWSLKTTCKRMGWKRAAKGHRGRGELRVLVANGIKQRIMLGVWDKFNRRWMFRELPGRIRLNKWRNTLSLWNSLIMYKSMIWLMSQCLLPRWKTGLITWTWNSMKTWGVPTSKVRPLTLWQMSMGILRIQSKTQSPIKIEWASNSFSQLSISERCMMLALSNKTIRQYRCQDLLRAKVGPWTVFKTPERHAKQKNFQINRWIMLRPGDHPWVPRWSHRQSDLLRTVCWLGLKELRRRHPAIAPSKWFNPWSKSIQANKDRKRWWILSEIRMSI